LKGGSIVTGLPNVLIGTQGGGGGGGGAGGGAGGAPGPVGTTNVGPSIQVKGTEEFREKTVQALAKIAQTPSGAKLLNDLHRSGKTITIVETAGGNGASYSGNPNVDAHGHAGPGADTTVKYNPNKTSLGPGPAWKTRPPEIGLAHELIHAKHASSGERDASMVQNDHKPDPADPTKFAQVKKEEARTVGFPPYDNEPYSENSIRKEWDPPQPERPFY